MIRVQNCWLGLCLMLLAPFADAADQESVPASPESVIQRVSDELLQLIEESRGYVKEDPERFFSEVETLLLPAVDFKGFARGVMAVHYKRANDDQRERFTETFKWGLVRTYSLALSEFQDGDVVMVPGERPSQNPKRKNVKMEIRTGSGGVYPITFSMKLGKDDVWRLGNIIINGINIGLTYRSQFASAVQDQKYKGDMDQVIDAWAEVLVQEGEPPGLAVEGT
jgi:phospholipid transport system substrate-binding protein